MSTPKIALALATTLALGSCRSPEGEYVAPRSMPARGPSDAAQQPAMDRNDGVSNEQAPTAPAQAPPRQPAVQPPPREPVATGPPPMQPRDSSTPFIEEFCNTVVQRSAGRDSIGCLPLVSYDGSKDGPYVTEYGVEVADQVAGRLIDLSFAGPIFDTNSMGVKISNANVTKASLSTTEAVAKHSGRLEADLVVFGSVRRDDNVGRMGRDVLTVDLNCWDVAGNRIIAREKFEVPSDDRSNGRIWRLVQQSSLWGPDSKWDVPEAGGNFMGEVRIQASSLASKILQSIDAAKISGIVYIPPTDTSPFVQAIADLRAAQASFGAEYTRRVDVATTSGEPLDTATPVALNGNSFPDLQSAQAHLKTMREDLLASEAVRFGQSVSSMLGEALQPNFRPHEVRVNDLGFTKWSDTQLVEGELALGGLARSAKARAAMGDAGIALVIAPRLERFGDDYALRADVYDLERGSILTSAHVTVSGDYTDALEAELAVQLPVRR